MRGCLLALLSLAVLFSMGCGCREKKWPPELWSQNREFTGFMREFMTVATFIEREGIGGQYPDPK
jgi:hypothetical protein